MHANAIPTAAPIHQRLVACATWPCDDGAGASAASGASPASPSEVGSAAGARGEAGAGLGAIDICLILGMGGVGGRGLVTTPGGTTKLLIWSTDRL